jgi:hypothetical protein
MSALRVELFHDDDAGNWHYRVPALNISGGGTATRVEAEQECLAAISFAREEDPADDLVSETIEFVLVLGPRAS